MGPIPHLWFLHAKQRLLVQNYKSLRVPDLINVFFWMQNNVISIRISSLYWSQPSSLVFHAKQWYLVQNYKSLCVPDLTYVFYIQNSDFSIRNTSLYGSHPSSVVFACKTSILGPELQVSLCARPHLSLCACKTTWLASEILVSMGPRPHLCFLQLKQCLLDQNYKSLLVPDLTKVFVHAK